MTKKSTPNSHTLNARASMAEDILKRLMAAMSDDQNGGFLLGQNHLKVVNEAFAVAGKSRTWVYSPSLGADEEIIGYPRLHAISNEDYADKVNNLLGAEHALIRAAQPAEKECTLVDVYVNVETTVPQSRLDDLDLGIAGTYRVQVPCDRPSSEQAGIALDLFMDKVGITEPAHFDVNVIKVLLPSESYKPGSLRDLGVFKGAHCFHPNLTRVARKP